MRLYHRQCLGVLLFFLLQLFFGHTVQVLLLGEFCIDGGFSFFCLLLCFLLGCLRVRVHRRLLLLCLVLRLFFLFILIVFFRNISGGLCCRLLAFCIRFIIRLLTLLRFRFFGDLVPEFFHLCLESFQLLVQIC